MSTVSHGFPEFSCCKKRKTSIKPTRKLAECEYLVLGDLRLFFSDLGFRKTVSAPSPDMCRPVVGLDMLSKCEAMVPIFFLKFFSLHLHPTVPARINDLYL